MTDRKPEMKGWLSKWTNYIKGYQRRWFVLCNGLLSYYRNQAEVCHTCRGTISLVSAVIHTEDSCHFVISNGGTQTFHLKTASEVDRQRWVTALELAKARAIRTMEQVPGRPESLKVILVTSTTIEVEWMRPAVTNGPLDGYNIVFTEEGSSNIVFLQSKTTECRFKGVGLTPWTSYTVSVRAYNYLDDGAAVTEESEAESVVAQTEVGEPSEPKNLKSVDVTENSLTIEWNPPEKPNGPIDGYQVTYKTTKHDELNKIVRTAECTLRLVDLSPDTTYIVIVQAFNKESQNSQADLLGLASAEVTISTVAAGPKTVSGLRVTSVNTTRASFKWEAPVPSAESAVYDVNLYKSDLKNNQCLKSLEHVERHETRGKELELENLLPYSCYHLSVSVPTTNETHQVAVLVSFRTRVGGPKAPHNLQINQITDSSVEIEWSEPREVNGPLDGYLVEYETHGKLESKFRGETVHCRFRADGLKPWTNYTFTVRAFNVDSEDGNAMIVGESAGITIQTDSSVPSTPRNLTLLKVNSTYASLRWVSPKPTVGKTWYKVTLIRSNMEEGKSTRFLENVASRNTFEAETTFEDLAPNSCYYVTVSAVTEKGTSTNSVVTAFVTQVYNGLPAPSNLQEIMSTLPPQLA